MCKGGGIGNKKGPVQSTGPQHGTVGEA